MELILHSGSAIVALSLLMPCVLFGILPASGKENVTWL